MVNVKKFVTQKYLNAKNDGKDVNRWADNGAFLTQAYDIGLQSHISAFNELVELLRAELEKGQVSSSIPLCEILWNNAHPMKYSFT